MIIKILITFYLISNAFSNEDPYVVVLGIAQDGGYPHAGCIKKCCEISALNSNLKLPQNTTEFNQKIQSSTQKGPMNSAIYQQLLGT